jgi:hypothetical protein
VPMMRSASLQKSNQSWNLMKVTFGWCHSDNMLTLHLMR